jgi:glycosyltransferase involved in cell wall biosynthesis
MKPPARQPRLVVAVANGITGDSRVQKTAIAAARAGWDVTLIGASTTPWTERSMMGPIKVIRVPIASTLRERPAKVRKQRVVVRQVVVDKRAIELFKAEFKTWERRATARIGWLRARSGLSRLTLPVTYPASYALGAVVRARQVVHKSKLQRLTGEIGEVKKVAPIVGDWRRDLPSLLDLDLAFGPVIEKAKPDVIHANDITMIGTAALSVARMRARGERVKWLYDAHEYVVGVDWRTPAQGSAYLSLERDFIHRADAVVTVSPEIAELLRNHYRLPRLPDVVRNTPIMGVVEDGTTAPSVRAVCELPDDVPLLVYSGWISAERGLPSAIRALAQLPEVHFAIVANGTNPDLATVLAKADELGVRDRVHVVPYVAQHAVPAYLSSADLGVICSLHSINYENSLPTKLSEYLHAGLPVVVSDLRTLSEFVRRHGVGEIFKADDPDAIADAVMRALEVRQSLAANISNELLTELSWEHQSAGLIRLYSELSGKSPTAQDASVSWTVEEQSPSGTDTVGTATSSDTFEHSTRWRPLGLTAIRLGIGPGNYAGQAAAFAWAVTKDCTDVSAEVFMRLASTGQRYPADVYIDPARAGQLDTQVKSLERVIGRYTHLIADAFLPVFGSLNGDNIEDDLPALKRARIKVALLGHGSEVRHPGRHLAAHEHSLFHDAPQGMVGTLTTIAERNRRVAEESGLPVFVTTPDLLEDLPWATWVPLVVGVDAWASRRPIMERARPVVLHAPSRRWTKSTERILPTLTDLHDRGVIELVLGENLEWAEMKGQIDRADIVVDQFGTGAYGTFAVEAMAAGKPVIAYLSAAFERVMPKAPPVINATPKTLHEAIERLLDDRESTIAIGAASATYARTYHDGRHSAQILRQFLLT